MRLVTLPSGEYADLTLDDYHELGISGFYGGASWLFKYGIYGISYVIPIKTPREIRAFLEAGGEIRAKVVRTKLDDNYQM